MNRFSFYLEVSVIFPNDAMISCCSDLVEREPKWEFWHKCCPGSSILLNEDIEKANEIIDREGEKAWKKAKSIKLGKVFDAVKLEQGEFSYIPLVYKTIRWKGCDLTISADVSVQTFLG